MIAITERSVLSRNRMHDDYGRTVTAGRTVGCWEESCAWGLQAWQAELWSHRSSPYHEYRLIYGELPLTGDLLFKHSWVCLNKWWLERTNSLQYRCVGFILQQCWGSLIGFFTPNCSALLKHAAPCVFHFKKAIELISWKNQQALVDDI